MRIWSPPPITSQRYQRAPASHAALSGRNHAQLRMVRIARLSSAPVKSMKSLVQVRKAYAATLSSSYAAWSNSAGRDATAMVWAVWVSSHETGSVSLLGCATSSGVSRRQAPMSGAAALSEDVPPAEDPKQAESRGASSRRGATTRRACGTAENPHRVGTRTR